MSHLHGVAGRTSPVAINALCFGRSAKKGEKKSALKDERPVLEFASETIDGVKTGGGKGGRGAASKAAAAAAAAESNKLAAGNVGGKAKGKGKREQMGKGKRKGGEETVWDPKAGKRVPASQG